MMGGGWSCASRAGTATRRDVDGRSRLTYLDVALRAQHRAKPSVASPHGATCYAASRRHTTTNYQLASPLANKKPTNKAAGRVTARLK